VLAPGREVDVFIGKQGGTAEILYFLSLFPVLGNKGFFVPLKGEINMKKTPGKRW